MVRGPDQGGRRAHGGRGQDQRAAAAEADLLHQGPRLPGRRAPQRRVARHPDRRLFRLPPVRFAKLDDVGRLLSGDPPTKEVPLHSAIYETVTSSGAVVHLHFVHSVAVSMLPAIAARRCRR